MKGFFPSSILQKEAPSGWIPRCGLCGLSRSCKSPKMTPYGEGQKGILVLGEAPGEKEDEQGRPFVGKAGVRLRQTLNEIGVDLDKDAWTTNALICRPPGNRTPDSKQISYCRPNLLGTLRKYQPKRVITLGRVALESILAPYWKEVGPLERWVGWKIPLNDFWLCPTYHPSYLLRMNDPLLNNLFERHLSTALTLPQTLPKKHDWKREIEILYDADAITHALETWIRGEGWIAVDYETNCIKPERAQGKVVSFAVSDGRRTISFPWIEGKVKTRVGDLLRSQRTRKIASNLKFEDRWTRHLFGWGVSNWGWDTMLAAHCLDNRQGICSLKFQALVRLGVPAYNQHIEPFLNSFRGPYNRIEEIEMNDLLFYGGMDAVLEYHLAQIQRKDLGYED